MHGEKVYNSPFRLRGWGEGRWGVSHKRQFDNSHGKNQYVIDPCLPKGKEKK